MAVLGLAATDYTQQQLCTMMILERKVYDSTCPSSHSLLEISFEKY